MPRRRRTARIARRRNGPNHSAWQKEVDQIEHEQEKDSNEYDRLEENLRAIDLEIEDESGKYTSSEYRDALQIVKSYERSQSIIKKLAPKRKPLLDRMKVLGSKFPKYEKILDQLARVEPGLDE